MNRINTNQGTILIVEDDSNTAALVARYLEREGFSTHAVHDGGLALAAVEKTNPVFIVLDVMLPGMDGWEICRTLRRSSDVPILLLTAREDEADRVSGLALGADDYVVKPFSPRELVERVKAILRRSRTVSPSGSAVLSQNGLELDSIRHTLLRNGRPINLTPLEYKLLHVLMGFPGKAFSREELLDRCYPHGENVVDRVIDVHIGKLRQKIEEVPSEPRFILTVRGYGYRFNDGTAEP